jgi:hypothetical protein
LEQSDRKDQGKSLLRDVQEYSKVVFGAESVYRLSLIGLVDKIVRGSISSNQNLWDETAYKLTRTIESFGPSKDKRTYDDIKSFESPEESRAKLSQAYMEVLGTINEMKTEQLVDLVVRLRSDRLLIRVLHSLPKKRIGKAYSPIH